MNRKHLIIPLVLAIVAIIPCIATAAQSDELLLQNKDRLIDSLRTRLSHISAPHDSVTVMWNLYDLLPRSQSTKIGDSLYHTSMRAGDIKSALDILRNQANRFMRNDSVLGELRDKAMKCPDGNDRRETLTFIRFMENMNHGVYSSTEVKRECLNKSLEEIDRIPASDIYDRVAVMHGICMLLSSDPNSDLLLSYMDSLSTMIKRLPPSASSSLRNAYNVHAASIFSFSHPDLSMVADNNTLREIEQMQRHYREQGRLYRNYHPSMYTVYSRLLSNYELLDTAQVEQYHELALEQIKYDKSIQTTHERTQLPDIYKYMFYHDYGKALPLIKKALDSSLTTLRRSMLLKMEIECARALNDRDTLLEALEAYTKTLEQEIDERSQSNYRELQTAYAIYDMKARVSETEMRRKETEASMQQIIIIVGVIALIVLAILFVILMRQSRKNKILAANLTETNKKLSEESKSLHLSRAELIRTRDQAQKANNLKTDFIKNMSYEVKIPLMAINEYSHLIADSVNDLDDEANSPTRHLARFADMLELNSELLSTIISDVLRLSEIDAETMPVHCQVINLQSLCESTIESVKHRLHPGVKLTLDPQCGRLDVFSDSSRLQQILNNLLTNAAKFTKSGSIVLSYRLDEATQKVIMSVTDTGIGINPENKEKIFERFVKLNHDTQGAGLGLTISRLLARLLNGDLYLDTTYTDGGSRFVLTFPKK